MVTAALGLFHRGQLVDHRAQIGRQRRVDAELPAFRPLEADAVRVQEHALESQRTHRFVEVRVAVLFIPCHGVAGVRGVHADLVRATGLEHHLEQGGDAAEELHGAKAAHRRLATLGDLHRAFATDARIGAQRHVDALVAQVPGALHQGEVALLEAVLAQQRMQAAQRAATLGDEQTAAGIAVQAVDQFQRFLRPQGPQRLDHPEAHPAAAMHGHPCGLVDHQQAVVFVNDGFGDALAQGVRGPGNLRLGRGQVDRRDAHLVREHQAGLGAYALAVYPHLALPDDAHDAAARQAAQALVQVVVQAQARLVLGYLDQLDAGADWGGFLVFQGCLCVRHCFYNAL
jgi:hypothetical protein